MSRIPMTTGPGALHSLTLASSPAALNCFPRCPRDLFTMFELSSSDWGRRGLKKATRHFQKDLWPLDPSKAPRCAPLRLVLVVAYPMPNPYLLKLQGLWPEL